MSEPTFDLLFPTPVMRTNIDRVFSQEELACVEKHLKGALRNESNLTSANNYIFNEPEFLELKNIATKYINYYINRVYKPKNAVDIFITQSWLNWTSKGEYHHKHDHPNSIISGVMYIQTDPLKDQITFYKPGYSFIDLDATSYDIFNCYDCHLAVKSGDIVLFPSQLSHNVNQIHSDKTRISLAFNTFIRGTFGSNQSLKEVKNA
jgi:uncharacterized protein (TIGR02466 family)